MLSMLGTGGNKYDIMVFDLCLSYKQYVEYKIGQRG